MIEVNFPEKDEISYAEHNFTGIEFTTETGAEYALADISVMPFNASEEALQVFNDPMDLEDVSSTLNTPPVLVDPVEPPVQQPSLLQAALQFKSEMNKMTRKKSVRFAPEEDKIIEEGSLFYHDLFIFATFCQV